MTHTDDQSHEIHKNNAILVSKLSRIANGGSKPWDGPQRRPAKPIQSSATINRRKQDDEIARANAAMARRLNSVKPTSTLSAKTAAKHAAEHRQYLRISTKNTAGNPLAGNPLAGTLPRARGSSAAHVRPPTMPRLLGSAGGGPMQF